MGPWAEGLVEAAGVRPGHAVLDAACGTGAVARIASQVAGVNGKVVGLDVNSGMLDVARSVPVAEGENLSWIEGDVANTDLDGDSFDVVLSQQGIQYFPDKAGALRELYRVLAPGGRLVMSVWIGPSAFTKAVLHAIEQHLSDEWGRKYAASRPPLDQDEIRDIMGDAGFGDVAIETQELEARFPVSYIPQHLSALPFASAINDLTTEAQTALFNQVEQELIDRIHNGQIIVSDAVHIISGLK